MNHWYSCYECGETEGYEAHYGYEMTEDGRTICEVCKTIYGEPMIHEHKMELQYDEMNHWYSCYECGETEGYEAHYGYEMTEDGRTICEVCKTIYGEPMIHEHRMELQYDEMNHWYSCYECGETEGFEAHYGYEMTEDGRTICEVCKTIYGEPMIHEHKMELQYDEMNHWYSCYECGETEGYEAHYGYEMTEDGRTICEVCGCIYGEPMIHEHKMELQYDDMNHWYSCYECGETEGYEAHYGYEMTEDGRTICEVCKTIYGEPMIHEHKMELQYDDMNHWYSCYECGETEGYEAHYGYEMTEDGRTICEV